MRTFSMFALILVASFFAGCSNASTGTVDGTVSVNGKPVNGLELEFTPIGHDTGTAMAYTHDGGKYKLVIGRGEPGIPVGDYQVTIKVFSEDPDSGIPDLKLPATYTQLDQTTLKETVKPGANTIDFDLKSE